MRAPGARDAARRPIRSAATRPCAASWTPSAPGSTAAACWPTAPALELDLAKHHPRRRAPRRPRSAGAAWSRRCSRPLFTEQAFHGASDCLQVFGGHGYVREWGIEQIVRDARVTMIYEGTNEIQAIDLLVRKVLPDGGAGLAATAAANWRAELDAGRRRWPRCSRRLPTLRRLTPDWPPPAAARPACPSRWPTTTCAPSAWRCWAGPGTASAGRRARERPRWAAPRRGAAPARAARVRHARCRSSHAVRAGRRTRRRPDPAMTAPGRNPAPAPTDTPVVDQVDTSYLETPARLQRAPRRAGHHRRVPGAHDAVYGLRPVDFSVLSLIVHNPGHHLAPAVHDAGHPAAQPGAAGQRAGKARADRAQAAPARRPRHRPAPDRCRASKLMREAEQAAARLEGEMAAHLTPAEHKTLLRLLRKVYQRP